MSDFIDKMDGHLWFGGDKADSKRWIFFIDDKFIKQIKDALDIFKANMAEGCFYLPIDQFNPGTTLV